MITDARSHTRIDGQASEHVRNIVLDIVLTLLTFGLFTLYVQHRQMRAVDAMLREGRYSWGMWLLLTIITFGLYHIYHEYRKSRDIASVMTSVDANEGLISVILTVMGLFVVADAIQQSHINRYFGSSRL